MADVVDTSNKATPTSQCEATMVVGGGLNDKFLMRCQKERHDDDYHAYKNVGRIPKPEEQNRA